MNDQPKPTTGEWTVETNTGSNEMKRIMSGEQKVIGWTMRPYSESFQNIADAHNAALAAEREKWRKVLTAAADLAKQTFAEKDKQLAAEREAGRALMQMHKEAVCKCNELREQVRVLVDALKPFAALADTHTLQMKIQHEDLIRAKTALEKV